jgi:hypothetical protein
MAIDILNIGLIGIVVSINVILLVFNIVLLITLVAFVSKFRRQYIEVRRTYREKIEKANTEALSIIDEASKKSAEMLAIMKVDVDEIRTKMQGSLRATADTHTNAVEQSINDINADYEKFLDQLRVQVKSDTQKMVDTVVTKSNSEIAGFVDTLKRGTVEAQEKFQQDLHNEFSNALKGIKEYREEQLRLVENSINRIIIKVTRAVLAEAISVTDHEKTIFESLERAKKEEVFEGILKTKT